MTIPNRTIDDDGKPAQSATIIAGCALVILPVAVLLLGLWSKLLATAFLLGWRAF